MNYNKVLLIGNLTRDPVLRHLASGTPVCEFGLAINRRYRRGEENVEETCFVEVNAWARQAETCNEFLKKGSGVFVEGRLHFDSWETPEGQKRNKLKVVAERVNFMPRAGGGGPRGGEDMGNDVSDYGARYSAQDSGPDFDPEVPF